MSAKKSDQPQSDVARMLGAYTRIEDEISAVTDDRLTSINLDVPTAITTVLGVLPEVSAYAKAAKDLPDIDASCFAKLEDYALALGHAQTMFLAASAPQESLAELAAKAVDTRNMLFSDVEALAKHGFIDPSTIGEVNRNPGHRGVAFDVLRLVQVLRERWDTVGSKTPVTSAQLDEFAKLAETLLTNVGLREQGPAVVSDASLQRQRAFTLFVNSYDQVRRAVMFLRWNHGDVDQIAPSLYAGRGGRRAKVEEPIVQAVSPSPQPVATHATGNGTGMPGSSPFNPG